MPVTNRHEQCEEVRKTGTTVEARRTPLSQPSLVVCTGPPHKRRLPECIEGAVLPPCACTNCCTWPGSMRRFDGLKALRRFFPRPCAICHGFPSTRTDIRLGKSTGNKTRKLEIDMLRLPTDKGLLCIKGLELREFREQCLGLPWDGLRDIV